MELAAARASAKLDVPRAERAMLWTMATVWLSRRLLGPTDGVHFPVGFDVQHAAQGFQRRDRR
jgi:hypothetical protein